MPRRRPRPAIAARTPWPTVTMPGFETFLVSAALAEGWTIIGLRGELDRATVAILADALDEAINGGTRRLILDSLELNFVDAAGLRVIAEAGDLLTARGGSLTIRSPSPMTRRILGIVGLSDWEESAGLIRPGSPAKILTTARTATPSASKLSMLPSSDTAVDSALRLVVALARATVGGADGVSVSLRRHGELATVAATDQTILDMDAGQYITGQGPCVDASVEGRRFLAEALDTEQRWPEFTPKARALGISAILSSPVLASDQPIGALNIYSRTTGAFAPEAQELASLFATEASTILTEAGSDVADEQVANRFHQALQSRKLIAQAQGVLMERSGVSEDEAFDLLRHFSAGTNTALQARAGDVVESALRPLADPRAAAGRSAMTGPLAQSLDVARRDAELSHGELWLRYFELGGMGTALQLEAILYGALRPATHDRDLVAHALNERFSELGAGHPVPYGDRNTSG